MKYIILLVLCSCGISKNLDKVGSGMDSMNSRIDRMTRNTDGMNDAIKRMAGSLASTSDGIHMQSLSVMLTELLKPENTKYITLTSVNTIPMIPSAKGFAETATQEELAGLAFLWISEINQAQVTDVLTKEQKDSFDLGKYIKLNALQMIAGFIPDATVKDLIKVQIEEGGIYQTSAYQLLLLRSMFIQNFLVDQAMTTTLSNPTQYRGLIKYLDQLAEINKLPNKEAMTIKLFGFYDTDENGLNQTFDMQNVDVCFYYAKLKNKFDKELDIKYQNADLTDIKTKLEGGCTNE
jgi:hypothetical protein